VTRSAVAAGARWFFAKVARTLDVAVAGGPGGFVVALVGPDGAGKSTLSDGLRSRWPGSSRAVYMGLWQDGRWDRLLHRVPGGRLGQRTARAVRGTLSARWHRACGRLVVLDRSQLDVRLPGAHDGSLGGRITERVLTTLAPEPDLVVVLDAPGEVMFERKGEHSAEVLEQRRQGYLALAAELPASLVVDATLPPGEVASRVLSRIWDRFAARERAGARR
jgi:thymidylate kinase